MSAPLTPVASEQSVVCPNCGGALRFTTDPLGYGQTIEQCERVLQCGHFRTLEVLRRPAHTPVPRDGSAESPPRHSSPEVGRMTRKYVRTDAPGALQDALFAVLPSTAAEAMTPGQLATAAQRARATVQARLFSLWQSGAIQSRKVGDGQRAPRLYWREV